MRIVFMGTPDLAATILQRLIAVQEVVAVYTRSDAIRGRGKQPSPSPVKRVAVEAGVPVYTPANFRDPQTVEALAALKPDVICVAAYGVILPSTVLDIPPYGCLNVHGSLLPRWRGAAPIQRAILAGDADAGICIMRMDAGMDTGDYSLCRSTPIGEKTSEELTAELAQLGAEALIEALDLLTQGSLDWTSQDQRSVTIAPKLCKGELDLDPERSAIDNARRVQASDTAHPSRARIAGRRVSVLRARVLDAETARELVSPLASGSCQLFRKRLLLGCGSGVLEVIELKPDGKKAMAAKAFAAGVPALHQGDAPWSAPFAE